MSRQWGTAMSLLEAPYLIEAPPNGSAIVAPYKIEAPGTSNTHFNESIHKYMVQTQHVFLKITIAAKTTCFTFVGLLK